MAGKTGTSNLSRDAWFIGYTPDIAIGIFVGFDDQTMNLGKNSNGSNTALPIFKSFMYKVKPYIIPTPFRVPKGIKWRRINLETGGIPEDTSHEVTIMEAFKEEDEDSSSSENVVLQQSARKASQNNMAQQNRELDEAILGSNTIFNEDPEKSKSEQLDLAKNLENTERNESRKAKSVDADMIDTRYETKSRKQENDKEKVAIPSSIKSERITTSAPIVPVISEPTEAEEVSISDSGSRSDSQPTFKEEDGKDRYVITPLEGIY